MKKLGDYHDLYLKRDTLLQLMFLKLWQVALKKTKIKLELLIDRGGLCYSINRYVKSNIKNEESSYFKYWDANNLYGLATLQKLLDKWI